jgi:hypothetical protein
MKNYFRLFRHRFALVSLMLTMCLSLSQSALANNIHSRVDTSRLCEITVSYEDGNTPIQGAEFELYLVADIDENYNTEVSNDFALSAVDLDLDLDDENIDWNARAVSLENYIAAMAAEDMAIEPLRDGFTDSEGELEFDNLNEGLYLLVGEEHTQASKSYVPLAELITMPYIDDDENVSYDVTVIPKMSDYDSVKPVVPTPPESDYYLTVLKIWKDGEDTANRPEEVTVVLVKDGEVYDRVKLNKDNSWRHTWTKLDEDARWQLYEEDVPSGYNVTAELDGNVFVVTNTKKDTPSSGGDIPKKSTTEATTEATTSVVTEITTVNPGDKTPTIPDNSKNTTESSIEETTDNYTDAEVDNPGSVEHTPGYRGDSYSEKRGKQTPGDEDNTQGKDGNSSPNLPQTGKLWWPIPVCSIAGIMLVIVGVFMRRCHRDEA